MGSTDSMIEHRVVRVGIVGIVLILAGCASSAETSTATQPTPPPSAVTSSPSGNPGRTSPPGNPGRTITVSIRAGKVDPPPGRIKVARGATVRLVVTSDVADELHVHGYDREVTLPARTPTTLEFTADQAGLFEVETHETDTVLFQLQVE
jgi:hypothetical protein